MTATLDAPVLGATEPRLWTQPLRELTPATSAGYEAIAFAEQVLGMRLMAWQKWFLIHALELKEDGFFRFAVICLLVARQNGKTVTLRVIVLWFMYVQSRKLNGALVLTAAQDLKIAREFWQSCVDEAEGNEELAAEINNIRYANGEQCLTLDSGARHMLTAATRGAGRGFSTDLLLLDELREQRTTQPWAALQSTTVAKPHALIITASNQGDDESIVLNDLRTSALAGTDPTIGIFEWSADDDSDIDDVEQWAKANPALGRTLTLTKLRSMRNSSAVNDFRTENLCQRVDTLNSAINFDAYRLCKVDGLTLKHLREQIVACVDVSADETHVTLAIAAIDPDWRMKPDIGQIGMARRAGIDLKANRRVVVAELVAAWSSVAEAREKLPKLLKLLKPRALGWFPQGSASTLKVEIRASHGVDVGRKHWDGTFREHSPGVVDITGDDVNACCMAFANLVLHQGFKVRPAPLLDDHIQQAGRYDTGEGGAWRFARKGMRPIDATYAVAGAVHLARSLPEYQPPPFTGMA